MKPSKTSAYSQIMIVKPFDIEAKRMVCLLNHCDAVELGVFPLDRVEIKNPKNGKRITALVDTTDSMVEEDEIGMFRDVWEKIGARQGQALEVKAVPRPESVKAIKKKLDGEKLSEQEIRQIVKDVGENKIDDIELSAFVAAVYINGYSLEETAAMTKALTEDGVQLKIRKKPIIDKHSIGGVNGRATMIIVPIMAAAGLFMPKTSSRSITSAAGTADSMEVLANVSLSIKQITSITEKTGGVIVWGGALDLAPVDDKIIKVEHPLSLDPEGQVIASVMAKKASVGAKFVVIDLPVGPDVKISSMDKAKDMAQKFIEVGKRLGIKVEVLLTDGTTPSGPAFGPALEAKHALMILEGKVFDNLAQKSCELAGALFELVGRKKKGEGYDYAKQILLSGKALKKMREIIKAQGEKASESAKVPKAKFSKKFFSSQSGVISRINVRKCISVARTAGCPADKLAGLVLKVEEGAKIRKGDELFEIFAENKRKLGLASKLAESDGMTEMQRIIIQKID